MKQRTARGASAKHPRKGTRKIAERAPESVRIDAGAIAESFSQDSPQSKRFELQPCRASTIILLNKAIPSLLLHPAKIAETTFEDLFRALAILSLPIADARAAFESGGLDEIATEIADCFPANRLPHLAVQITAVIVEVFAAFAPTGKTH